MHAARRLSLLVLFGLVAGCATSDTAESPSLLQRFGSLTNGLGPDAIDLEVAVVRQPVGDRYINQAMWVVTDEQIVPLEHKPVLEANGYRVGTICGNPPSTLQNLLTSERDCTSARRIVIRPDNCHFVPLGPAARKCQLNLPDRGQGTSVDIADGQFGIYLSPSRTEDGRIRVKFEPCVRFAFAMPMFRPADDGSGWTYRSSQPENRYPEAGWDLTLAPNEYAVIGGLVHAAQTLGYYSFVETSPGVTDQYLLVVRTGSGRQEMATAAGTWSAFESPLSGNMPLAWQSIVPKPPAPRRSPRDAAAHATEPQ